MNKLDSMWYHEGPDSGPLASSHIALVFCALVKCKMIDDGLLEMEFEDIPNDFSDKSLSPMEYFLAYTDGELRDIYIKPKFRKALTEIYDGDKIYDTLFNLKGLEHDNKYETYTLKCNWHNVEVCSNWLKSLTY